MASLPLTATLAWSLALLMHWWPRLPPAWRMRASVATSGAGLAFLAAALKAEGLRESALTSLVLVGPATLTATASAQASLYYYVLTAVALLLGFAGLALGEPLARGLVARPLVSAAAVAWLVTLVRFLLEKSAAPALLVQAMGVTWLAPVAGAWLAATLDPKRSRGNLARVLVTYAFLVRGPVAFLGAAATRLSLGTHYDVSGVTSVAVALTGDSFAFAPGSGRQVFWLTLVPQLVVWPAYTVLAGLLGAALFRLRPTGRPAFARERAVAPPAAAAEPGREQTE